MIWEPENAPCGIQTVSECNLGSKIYLVLKVTLLDYILLMTCFCHLILDNICLIFYLLYFDWMLAVARGLPI